MASLMLRRIVPLMILLLLLLLADFLCYQQVLPLSIDSASGQTTLHVGSKTLPLGEIGTLQELLFEPHDPVVHEYQIDGSDSTNNFSLDTTYLHLIQSSPDYLFQAWMRNLDGTSRWSDVRVSLNGRLTTTVAWP